MAVVYRCDTPRSQLMAHLFVEGKTPEEGMYARAIVDTGATFSCISGDFARHALCLAPAGHVAIRMPAVSGRAVPWRVPCYEVKFTIVPQAGSERPELGDTLKMPALADIPIDRCADDLGDERVKILLGMDFLKKIHFGHCPPMPPSLFWLSTKVFTPRRPRNDRH
jgi:hypothetical protein